MNHRIITAVCCAALTFSLGIANGNAKETTAPVKRDIPYGSIDPALAKIAYSGTEKMLYEVAYTGGVKLGDLLLEIRPIPGTEDGFELYALITTEDTFFDAVYPIHDVHVTRVNGEERLPYFYEVWQKEGFSYEAHRQTRYDQTAGQIRYQKDAGQPVEYDISGPTHNEFSSFFSSRLMQFDIGNSFLIPTFADKRRVDVEVKILGKYHLKNTALGPVETVEVSPILKFKGLYDKRGDTTIWYTNDECRVPVKITSKIAIGSITSTLKSYDNPACTRYTQFAKLDN
jgi:hypothetical protein